jgi:hypothetical protein
VLRQSSRRTNLCEDFAVPRSKFPFGFRVLTGVRAALLGAAFFSLACSDHEAAPFNPSDLSIVDFETSADERPRDGSSTVSASGLVPNTQQMVRLATDTTRCWAVSDDLRQVGNPVIVARCGVNNPRMLFTFNSASEIRTSANSCIGAAGALGSPVTVVPCDGKPGSRWTYDGAQRLANYAAGCYTVTGITLTAAAKASLAPCSSPAPWSQKLYWNTPGTPVNPAPVPTNPTPTPPPTTNPTPTIASVQISPSSNSVILGDSIRLTPTAYNSSGQPVAATFVWSVSAGSNIVSVNQIGIVKGLNVGGATVMVTASGVSGAAAVTVVAPPTAPPPSVPPPSTPPPSGSVPSNPPTLPLANVDVSWRPPTGRSIAVRAGDNLQNALNIAQRGDEIVIDANATFTGTFVLPAKSGSAANGWITVRTAALGSLPPAGTRVSTSHAGAMPKLVANSVAEVLRTAPGASGWRIVGIEMTMISNLTWVHNGLVLLGDGSGAQNQLAQVPSDIILDRVYIHGQPNVSLKRCVALNSARSAIVDSQLLECHGRGFDSQAILGWNGPGPYRIENNKLEGAGEVIMFGGADPAIPNLVPSDITIRRNYLYRPLSWKGVWTVKNLFELKNAQRVLVEGNVMENNWVDGQVGYAIVLGSADTGYSWCVVQDVTMRYNHIHNSAGAFNLFDRYGGAVPMRRVALHHNLITSIGSSGLGTNGRMWQLTGDIDDIWIEHNTGFAPITFMTFASFTTYKDRFAYRNNIGGGAQYNLHSPEGIGQAALTKHLSTPYVFAGNVFVGTNLQMPAANAYATSISLLGLVNPTSLGGTWSLSPLSPYASQGTGGATPGLNWSAFASLTSNVRM